MQSAEERLDLVMGAAWQSIDDECNQLKGGYVGIFPQGNIHNTDWVAEGVSIPWLALDDAANRRLVQKHSGIHVRVLEGAGRSR
ncbi:hypothetical protein [Paenarthrobacter sp. NPDC091669]|uniref:hypothetical protein n=1 Tax=Paenarthrobacter sp. NPDC091669 TaxID=3364384 RepID=UPI0038156CD7